MEFGSYLLTLHVIFSGVAFQILRVLKVLVNNNLRFFMINCNYVQGALQNYVTQGIRSAKRDGGIVKVCRHVENFFNNRGSLGDLSVDP